MNFTSFLPTARFLLAFLTFFPLITNAGKHTLVKNGGTVIIMVPDAMDDAIRKEFKNWLQRSFFERAVDWCKDHPKIVVVGVAATAVVAGGAYALYHRWANREQCTVCAAGQSFSQGAIKEFSHVGANGEQVSHGKMIHDDCLLKWLADNPTCPFCRGGHSFKLEGHNNFEQAWQEKRAHRMAVLKEVKMLQSLTIFVDFLANDGQNGTQFERMSDAELGKMMFTLRTTAEHEVNEQHRLSLPGARDAMEAQIRQEVEALTEQEYVQEGQRMRPVLVKRLAVARSDNQVFESIYEKVPTYLHELTDEQLYAMHTGSGDVQESIFLFKVALYKALCAYSGQWYSDEAIVEYLKDDNVSFVFHPANMVYYVHQVRVDRFKQKDLAKYNSTVKAFLSKILLKSSLDDFKQLINRDLELKIIYCALLLRDVERKLLGLSGNEPQEVIGKLVLNIHEAFAANQTALTAQYQVYLDLIAREARRRGIVAQNS